MSDKEIYRLIADELKTKRVDSALWTQAKEAALGDPNKAEAIYIRLRFVEFVKSPPQSAGALANLPVPVSGELKESDELSVVRRELTAQLENQKKHNLYSIIKLNPDADDAAIAKAISDLELGDLASSGIHPSEFKYAKETLGNASLRAQYDRQLLESFSNRTALSCRSYDASDEEERDISWWASRKTSFVIGVFSLGLMGYLSINYLKERNSHEIQKQAIESQQAALQAISNAAQANAQAKAQAEADLRNETSRLVAERQNQEMELRNRTADQMREEQRQLQESRMLAEQQRKEAQQAREAAQQAQVENMRVMKEKQYWSCMNMQLSLPNTSSYEAGARCSMYR